GAIGLFVYHPSSLIPTVVNCFVGVALLVAAGVSCAALGRGGLPKAAGAPPDMAYLKEPSFAGISREWLVYLATLIAIPVFVLFVSGFSILRQNGEGVALIPEEQIAKLECSENAVIQLVGTVAKEVSRPAGLVLFLSGVAALLYLVRETT